KPKACRRTQRKAAHMGPLDSNRLHKSGDVVGKQFHRIGAVRLVGLACSSRVKRDTGEVLGVVSDLKGITGMIGGEIGNENKWLSRSLLLVVDGDSVGLDFRHAYLPGGFLVGPRGCGAERASDYC